MFVKRVYIKLIDVYFPYASFYKSTGDGLLLTIPFDKTNLEEVSQKVISSCITCHSDFSDICKGDPMINFEVPSRIGIGIARGTACCLISGRRTIDYSGRLLNLTTKLTDLARPSGLVIDGTFDIRLLSQKQQEIFQEEEVYLKGIAEEEPIKTYFTPKFTTISKYNKQPIVTERWKEITDTKLFKDLLKLGLFGYKLSSEAVSREDVKVTIKHSKLTKGKVDPHYYSSIDFQGFTYRLERGKPVVIADFPKLCAKLKAGGVKKNMKITIIIAWVEK